LEVGNNASNFVDNFKALGYFKQEWFWEVLIHNLWSKSLLKLFEKGVLSAKPSASTSGW